MHPLNLDDDDVLLNRKEASSYLLTLGIRRAPTTLAKNFCEGKGPPCMQLGRTPYYPRSVLRRWAASELTDLRHSSSEPRRPREVALQSEPQLAR